MIYQHLRAILPGITNPVVIEIGAHLGTDTGKIAGMLQKPFTYLAVEPDSRNLPALRTLAQRLPISVIPAAVGGVDGDVPFYYSGGITKSGRVHTDSNSLMKPGTGIPAYITFKPGRVNCVRLDSLLAALEINRVDFIWMDVQGAEAEVIKGGRQTLAKTRYLYTECVENKVLYVGRPNLKQIMAALPGPWRVVFQTQTDVLLRNDGQANGIHQ